MDSIVAAIEKAAAAGRNRPDGRARSFFAALAARCWAATRRRRPMA